MRENEIRGNPIAEVARALGWTLALILLAAGAVQANELGRCYAANVPWVIVLPDGTEHPPGELKVCTTIQYSPVASLHTLWMGIETRANLLNSACRPRNCSPRLGGIQQQ